MHYLPRHCTICKEIKAIQSGSNKFLIREMLTGYLILYTYQFYRGYSILLCKKHVSELHELPEKFRIQFLTDMSIAAESVYKAFHPKKLNYELLGNTDSHLHWHIIPRYENDPIPQRPIWCIDSSITCALKMKPTHNEIKILKTNIINSYKTITQKRIV